ncbi:dephospho-CoA kinase domain-containing protein [Drosophila grimshawi]|uniref:Dephospho-CoA kinase domain-containing protein n=1 Tax=Drosophila grimshawi TaxID=7222 RepID=B4JHW2_DROGR|nr:dephospho-CoA kinase domain-containing protein [Drosophila grimshawi]EDV92870.1 GH19000 [Drosophila grimshawi]
MFIVAVTGGIATGKSTVTKIFERHGIPVIDADKIAREIVEPGQPCWQKIRDVFGDEVLLPSKELNRAVLGRLIFEDKELRGKLNQITHPVIHRTIFWSVFKHFMSGHAWIVLDLPLLFETGILMDFIHKIVTVTCDSEKQMQRLLARNELSESEAQHRVDSQMPLEKKCEKSHFVVDNNGSEAETEAAAMRIYNMMQESNQHWYNRFSILGVILIVCFTIYFLSKAFDVWPKSWSF